VAQPASPDSIRQCYKRYSVADSQSASFWRDMADGCSAQGARLATFTTRAEFDAASATCQADTSNPLYWEAGCWTDSVVDQQMRDRKGPWYWASSSSDSTALLRLGEEGLWSGSEPLAVWEGNNDKPEKCVQFLEGGLLNNYPCNGGLSAVCMHEQPLCANVWTCLNGGTQDQADCSCSCANECLNGGSVDNTDCSCSCTNNGCLNGSTLDKSDCSCSCASPSDRRNTDCSCSNLCPEGFNLDKTDCLCQSTSCPVGWEVAQPASPDSVRRCYKRYNVPSGQSASFWRNVADGCKGQGAQLATFTTWPEFDATSATCWADTSNPLYWEVGCWTDGVVDQQTRDRKGPWYWASSSSDSTALLRSGRGLWSGGEPSAFWWANNNIAEKCVQFLEGGLLNNYPCHGGLSAICMRKQPLCTTVWTCLADQIQDLITCICTSDGQPPSSPSPNAPNYRIAGAGATYPVKALLGWRDEANNRHDLLYLDLNGEGAWSGASCVNSCSLFKGANMAGVQINDRVGAVVRLAGDGDGGWLYRIVKCTTTNTLVLAVGDNWSLDDTHCPTDGPNSAGDCSKCMPRGRQSSDAYDYDSHCSSGPPSAKAAELTSVVLAGGKAGHLAYAVALGRWRMALPKSADCADLSSLFAATDTDGVVTMAGDALSAWSFTYSECDDASSTVVVAPYQWDISPDHCPYLDCSACSPTMSAADDKCSPSQLVPSVLAVETSGREIVLTWTFAAGSTSSFAVYTTTYRECVAIPPEIAPRTRDAVVLSLSLFVCVWCAYARAWLMMIRGGQGT
jgi:hypothetical protein